MDNDNHHPEIAEERLYFFGQQTVEVADWDAQGFILDLGGGGEGVIGRLKGAQVVAIDTNRRELEEAPPGPLKVVMDATALQFLDGAFGTVTAFFTLMYLPAERHRRVLEEVRRVLAPDGRFRIWDVAFPGRPQGEARDIAVFRLRVALPGEVIETGYGMRWPAQGRGLAYYVALAQAAGFEVLEQRQEGWQVYLVLGQA